MKQLFANNAATTVATSLAATDTALVVADGSSFPSPGANEYFLVTVELGSAREILMITARVGSTLTIGGLLDVGNTVAGRGQEGTTAQSFAVGAKVEARVTKNTLGRTSKNLAAINSITAMVSPGASYNEGYIVSSLDPFGNPIVLIAKDAYTWRSLNYTSQVAATSTATSTTSITAASVPLTGVVSGKYLVQFTSGINTGMLRQVTSISSGVVSWSGALATACTVGDTFEVLESNASILTGFASGVAIADASGTVDAITATYVPAITLVNDLVVMINLTGPNTSTTPTFNPNGTGAKTIVNNDGTAVVAGQLYGTVTLRYDTGTTAWWVVTSPPGASNWALNYYLGSN